MHIFQASGSVQRPVLLEALRLARNESVEASALSAVREDLVWEVNRIWSLSGRDGKMSKDVRALANGLLMYLKSKDDYVWNNMEKTFGITKQSVEHALNVVCRTADEHTEHQYPGVLPIDARNTIRNALDGIYMN